MEPFLTVRGVVAPMLAANIDTDVIMPKQFLKGIDRQGLGRGVFFDQRFLKSGAPDPTFVLNQPPWQDARFLAVGPNFGCGSSREHAVWGLKQLGIRALIGTTFAGIFFDNCHRNGLLTVELDRDAFAGFAALAEDPALAEIAIDLEQQRIEMPAGRVFEFAITPIEKDALLRGLDAIGSTLEKVDLIDAFEKRHLTANPWLA
ncbi:MAG: 3-isopropylmalate dehydratase small subunit [Pseudomonadota bacterium]